MVNITHVLFFTKKNGSRLLYPTDELSYSTMIATNSKNNVQADSFQIEGTNSTAEGAEYSNHYRPPRVHRQTLVEMNVSVFTARRDSAHQRVINILRREMMTQAKKQRRKLYLLCGMVLDEAIMCNRRSQLQTDSAVMHYLELLRDTVNAEEAIVRHEIRLNRESREFSGMLNQYVVTQLQSAKAAFSEGETNILDCIEDLLKFGDPILTKDTEERFQKFNEDDRRRYDLALKEYAQYYARFALDTPLKELSAFKR